MNPTDTHKDRPIEKQQNIQDGFLNSARKEKLNVTIYLLSGVKPDLEGAHSGQRLAAAVVHP